MPDNSCDTSAQLETSRADVAASASNFTMKNTCKTFVKGGGSQPHVAKRYKLSKRVVAAVKKSAATYGAQGRALQVATDLLTRMLPRRVKIARDFRDSNESKVGMSYKLHPHVCEQVEKLTKVYGTRGDVLAACATVLDPKFKPFVNSSYVRSSD